MHHLRPKRCANELATAVSILASLPAESLQHLGNGGTVLCVEVGVDFVEEVERRGIALLDREDESQRA
jgi:hypothetical protein